MSTKMLLFLLLLLPAPLSVKSERLRPAKFISHSTSRSWDEARDHCMKYHNGMLIIYSKEHGNTLLHAEGWIGVHRETSLSDWIWPTGQKANYTNFELQGPETDKDCAFKKKDEHKWEHKECTSHEDVLCVDQKLFLVREEKTWEEALQHCRSLVNPSKTATDPKNPAYDLVSLLSAQDRIYARELAHSATTDEVWTGLRFMAGQWFWVDGEEMGNMETDECPSDTLCGTVGKTSTDPFKKRMCEEKRNFFCFKKP